jgi:thiosulfate dehydrogenase
MRALPLVALLAAACSPLPADQYGHQLFSSTSVSESGSNPFTCALCHDSTVAPTKPKSGYTLVNSTRRPSYWGGFELTLLDAMNQCVTNFMRGSPLGADDDKARSLYVYLSGLSSTEASADALPLTIVKDIVDVPSGDAVRGNQTYHAACGVCHGEPHTGAGRISEQQTIIPDDTIKMWDVRTRLVVIEKVRHGKFFNIGGNMPPFATERLGDGDLGDILAYLEPFGVPPSQ